MSDVIGHATNDRIDHYRLGEMLGSGGMGTVYRARDTRLERDVALKILGRVGDDQGGNRARFAQEARALARLCDPHVVQIFDYVPEHEPPYLVMELVDGQSLSQVIRKDGAMDLPRIIDAALQILGGLNVAHRAGIIHRDVKPSNILLAANGTYKLVDFGLARPPEVDDSLTASGQVVGTAHYMSPECARGEPADERSDLYSLGMSLYHSATGDRPREHKNLLDLLSSVAEKPVEPIKVKIPALPDSLSTWFDRLCAFEANNRFQTALEARQALEAIAEQALLGCENTPIVAHPQISSAEMASSVTAIGSVTAHRPSAAQSTITSHQSDDDNPKVRFSFGFFVRILAAIWLIGSLGTLAAIVVITEDAIQTRTNLLKRQLLNMAEVIALEVNGDAHQRILAKGDKSDIEYRRLFVQLQRFKNIDPDIKYVYTMAPTERTERYGIMQFVCDATDEVDRNDNGFIDPEEEVPDIGEEYHAAENAPRMLDGLRQPITDDELTIDQWGATLSGYAPFKNDAGETVGLVGVDMYGDKIIAIRSYAYWRATFVLGCSLAAFLAAAALVARQLNRPIANLKRGLRYAERGDYHQDIPVIGSPEFKDLATCINNMLAGLRERDALRGAFERYVAREMREQLGGPRRGAGLSESDTKHSINLYCAVQRAQGDQAEERLERGMAAIIGVVFDFGGVTRRLIGNGLMASFDGTSEEETLEDRAIRAALAIQSRIAEEQADGGAGFSISIGIHSGADQQMTTHLAKACHQLGADILVSDTCFHPVRLMFYADRFQNLDLGRGKRLTAYAIKGAVSG